MPHIRVAKQMLAAAALGASLLVGPSSLAAATTLDANTPTNAQQLINAAADINLSVNGPLGQAAVAARETAKSPEMQKAVVSVWVQAWQAVWPFFRSMLTGFFGLFVTAWHSATAPATIKANVNASANVNAASTTN